MSEIEKLKQRVDAAVAGLARGDSVHREAIASLSTELADVKADLARTNAEKRGLEAATRRLAEDNRQLKEMLLALLASVESRSGERMLDTVRRMAPQVAAMSAPKSAPAPAPEPEPEPEPDGELLLTQLAPMATPEVATREEGRRFEVVQGGVALSQAAASRTIPKEVERLLFEDEAPSDGNQFPLHPPGSLVDEDDQENSPNASDPDSLTGLRFRV